MAITIREQGERLNAVLGAAGYYSARPSEYVKKVMDELSSDIRDIFEGTDGTIREEVKSVKADAKLLQHISESTSLRYSYSRFFSRMENLSSGIVRYMVEYVTKDDKGRYAWGDPVVVSLEESLKLLSSENFEADLRPIIDIEIPMGDKGTIKIQRGMKINKVIKKLFRELKPFFKEVDSEASVSFPFDLQEWEDTIYKDIEKIQTELSMINQQVNINGNMFLSMRPEDIMTISDNNSGWDSCMSIIGGGSYSAGASDLMVSGAAVVAFLSSGETFMPLGTKGPAIENKQWRRTGFVDGGVLTFQKSYPFQSKALDQNLIEMIERNTDYIHVPKDLLTVMIESHGDSEYYLDNSQPELNFVKKDLYDEIVKDEASNVARVSIHIDSVCMECGYDTQNQPVCYDCLGLEYCEDCGEYIDSDSMYEVRDAENPEYVTTTCEYCIEWSDHIANCDGCHECFSDILEYDDHSGANLGGRYCRACLDEVEQEVEEYLERLEEEEKEDEDEE